MAIQSKEIGASSRGRGLSLGVPLIHMIECWGLYLRAQSMETPHKPHKPLSNPQSHLIFHIDSPSWVSKTPVYSSYGNFPKQGDPNVDPKSTIIRIIRTPKKYP